MRGFFIAPQKNIPYRCLCSVIAFVLSVSLILTPSASYAQVVMPTVLGLPVPGAMIQPSPAFVPVLLKGMTIYPDDPLKFDFIIDSGNTDFTQDQIKKESEKLVKYFLASMTVPKDDLWVNLSPYEKDRIIPDELGKTELGRDMLAQDYILKQLTASLMYPEEELGKKFWDKVYKKAEEQFGTSEIPVNTFNKVWILPEEATVYEHEQTVYVVNARLKVMLDSDYEAMKQEGAYTSKEGQSSETSESIIREIIIPAIEKEVNEGAHFAPLRQIYHSLILAKWYKETVKNSLLSQVYVDKNLIDGVEADEKNIKDQIYAQYMQAYKKGVFNYIKEDYDQLSQEVIPRKYFSGGLEIGAGNIRRTSSPVTGNGFDGEGYRAEVGISPEGGKKGALSKLAGISKTVRALALAMTIICSGGGCGQGENLDSPQGVWLPNEWAIQYRPLMVKKDKVFAEERKLRFANANMVVGSNYTLRHLLAPEGMIRNSTKPYNYVYNYTLTNTGTKPIQIDSLQVVLFDRDGNVINSGVVMSAEQYIGKTSDANVDVLYPGETKEFSATADSMPNQATILVGRRGSLSSLFVSIELHEEFLKAMQEYEKKQNDKGPSSSPISFNNITTIPTGIIGALEEKGQVLSVKAGEVIDLTGSSPIEGNGILGKGFTALVALTAAGMLSVAQPVFAQSSPDSGVIMERPMPKLNLLPTPQQEILVRNLVERLNISKHPERVLIEALTHKDWIIRVDAAKFLIEMAEANNRSAVYAVPALIKATTDVDWRVRNFAVGALGKIGFSALEVVEALRISLKDKHDYVRANSAWALGEMGNEIILAVDDLINVSLDRDEDSAVRSIAIQSLGKKSINLDNDIVVRKSGMRRIVGMLTGNLGDPDKDVKLNSMNVLKKIAPLAKEQVPLLIKMLSDKITIVRVVATIGLGLLGPVSDDAIPFLTKIVLNASEDEMLRHAATVTLGDITINKSVYKEESISALKIVIKDEKNEQIRKSARESLKMIIDDLSLLPSSILNQSSSPIKIKSVALGVMVLLIMTAVLQEPTFAETNTIDNPPPSIMFASNEYDGRELIEAAYVGDIGKVQKLLKQGIGVNAKNNRGWTALIFAAQEGHLEIVEFLLKKGADVNVVAPKTGTTALMLAAQGGYLEIVKALLKKNIEIDSIAMKNGATALMIASVNDRVAVVEALLNKGADVDIKGRSGWTALMLASANDHIEIIKMLLDKDADTNVKNRYGKTALDLARENGKMKAEKILAPITLAGTEYNRETFSKAEKLLNDWSFLYKKANKVELNSGEQDKLYERMQQVSEELIVLGPIIVPQLLEYMEAVEGGNGWHIISPNIELVLSKIGKERLSELIQALNRHPPTSHISLSLVRTFGKMEKDADKAKYSIIKAFNSMSEEEQMSWIFQGNYFDALYEIDPGTLPDEVRKRKDLENELNNVRDKLRKELEDKFPHLPIQGTRLGKLELGLKFVDFLVDKFVVTDETSPVGYFYLTDETLFTMIIPEGDLIDMLLKNGNSVSDVTAYVLEARKSKIDIIFRPNLMEGVIGITTRGEKVYYSSNALKDQRGAIRKREKELGRPLTKNEERSIRERIPINTPIINNWIKSGGKTEDPSSSPIENLVGYIKTSDGKKKLGEYQSDYWKYANGEWEKTHQGDDGAVQVASISFDPKNGMDLRLYIDEEMFGKISFVDRRGNSFWNHDQGKPGDHGEIHNTLIRMRDVITDDVSKQLKDEGREISSLSGDENLYWNEPVVAYQDGKVFYAREKGEDAPFVDIRQKVYPMLVMWKDGHVTIEKDVRFELKGELGTNETDIFIGSDESSQKGIRSATFLQLILWDNEGEDDFIDPSKGDNISQYDDLKQLYSVPVFKNSTEEGVDFESIPTKGMSAGVFFGVDQLLDNLDNPDNPNDARAAYNGPVFLDLKLSAQLTDDEQKKLAEKLVNKLVDKKLGYTNLTDKVGLITKPGQFRMHKETNTIEIYFKKNNYPFHVMGINKDGGVIDAVIDAQYHQKGATVYSAYRLMKRLGAVKAGIVDQGQSVQLKVGVGKDLMNKRSQPPGMTAMFYTTAPAGAVFSESVEIKKSGEIRFSESKLQKLRKTLLNKSGSPILSKEDADLGGIDKNDPSSSPILDRVGLSEEEAKAVLEYSERFFVEHGVHLRGSLQDLLDSIFDPEAVSLTLAPKPKLDDEKRITWLERVLSEDNYFGFQLIYLNNLDPIIASKIYAAKLLSGKREVDLKDFLINRLAKSSDLTNEERRFLEGLNLELDLRSQGVLLESIEDYSSGRVLYEGADVFKITLKRNGQKVTLFLKGFGEQQDHVWGRPNRAQFNDPFMFEVLGLLGLNTVESEYYPIDSSNRNDSMMGYALMEEMKGVDTNHLFDVTKNTLSFKIKPAFRKYRQRIISEFASFAAVSDLFKKNDRKIIQNRFLHNKANFMIDFDKLRLGEQAISMLDHVYLFNETNESTNKNLSSQGNSEMGIVLAFSDTEGEIPEEFFEEYRTAYIEQWRKIKAQEGSIEELVVSSYGEGSYEHKNFLLSIKQDPNEIFEEQKGLLMEFHQSSSPILWKGPWTLNGARKVLGNSSQYGDGKVIRAIKMVGDSNKRNIEDIKRLMLMLSERGKEVRWAAKEYLTHEQMVDGYIGALSSSYRDARKFALEKLNELAEKYRGNSPEAMKVQAKLKEKKVFDSIVRILLHVGRNYDAQIETLPLKKAAVRMLVNIDVKRASDYLLDLIRGEELYSYYSGLSHFSLRVPYENDSSYISLRWVAVKALIAEGGAAHGQIVNALENAFMKDRKSLRSEVIEVFEFLLDLQGFQERQRVVDLLIDDVSPGKINWLEVVLLLSKLGELNDQRVVDPLFSEYFKRGDKNVLRSEIEKALISLGVSEELRIRSVIFDLEKQLRDLRAEKKYHYVNGKEIGRTKEVVGEKVITGPDFYYTLETEEEEVPVYEVLKKENPNYEEAQKQIREGERNLRQLELELEEMRVVRERSSSSPISSKEEVGGIDLNEIDVDRQGVGVGVDIQFDPIQVQEMIDMGITGFTPVIINLVPLPSVLPLLGLAPQKEEDYLEVSSLR